MGFANARGFAATRVSPVSLEDHSCGKFDANLLEDRAGAQARYLPVAGLAGTLSSASLPTRRLFCRPRPFC